MPWETSDRKERLPRDWDKRVARVKERDGWRCRKILPSGKRCPRGRATGHRLEVDHRIPNDDHSLSNLQALCEEHHLQKTLRESRRARWLPPPSKRTEPHPGDRKDHR